MSPPAGSERLESADLEKLIDLLKRYISVVNARALVLRALRENGLSSATVTRAELRKCSATLRRGVELFVAPDSREAALRDVALFCGSDSLKPDACSLQVNSEADVSRVRSEARRICERAGATAFVMQKVTTIASELARNIVLYAQRGIIEIVPVRERARKIIIRALDQGPGISNLDHVLSGRYQSKTGLGRGLLGSKRLADRFDISTGSAGTHVTIEVAL
jgi:serine/threonine-protein kinase RsbT